MSVTHIFLFFLQHCFHFIRVNGQKSPVSSLLFQSFPVISCQVFALFLMSSSTSLNIFVLGCQIILFPLKFNVHTLLGVHVLFILFTWPNCYSHFISNYIIEFFIPISYLKSLIVISSLSVFPSVLLKIFISIILFLLSIFFIIRVHISALNITINLE